MTKWLAYTGTPVLSMVWKSRGQHQEDAKLEKYQALREDLEKMWKVKATVNGAMTLK